MRGTHSCQDSGIEARRLLPLTALLALAGWASSAHASTAITHTVGLANRCVSIQPGGRHVFLKPTGIGTYMLYGVDRRLVSVGADGAVTTTDTPGPAAEWRISRAGRGRFRVRSTASTGVSLGTGAVTVHRARGCHPYPEASLGATGKTFKGRRRDGTVLGWADPHIHVTADERAGGLVISGQTFNRFGITEALGHDADEHGPDGSLDVTGNLLRSGSPAGTHDTNGWPTFAGWPTYDTYTHQQIYWRWLERAWMSGLRLIGAQVVEDAPLCHIEPRRSHSCDETATIALEVRELHQLQDYIDAQFGGRGRGFFRLVTSPAQARRVIESGKLAVLIGVESSNPFGCREQNGQPQCTKDAIDRGVDQMWRLGVRTMFPAHWVDNALAGAALEGGAEGQFISAMQVSYTGQPFSTGACPEQGQGEPGPLGGEQCNTRGLTELGAYAINRMIDRHMMIEADHLSERARQQVLAIAEKRHYPLVSSHTGTGGFWTPDDLRRLYGVGGFAVARLDDATKLPDAVLALRRYRTVNRTFGVGIGSDTGGFNELPGPQPGPLAYPFKAYRGAVTFSREQTGSKTYDLNRDGVAHYGLIPDLLAAVERQPHGRAALGVMFHSAEAYLEMWGRAYGG